MVYYCCIIMKIKHTLTALLLPLAFAACQKEEDKPQPQPATTDFLLKKISYASGVNAFLSYNPDSTLKKTDYTNGTAGGTVYINYANKQVTEMGNEISLYADYYTFENSRVKKVLTKWKAGTSPTSHYLEYAYNNDGTVATLKYFHTNEAGTTLKATSTYQYDAQKLVKQIVTEQAEGARITFKIDAYSDVYGVSPLVFVQPGLNELYTIYNYPVITSMNRLPAKITKLIKPAGGTEKEDAIYIQNYRIDKKKINTLYSEINFPEHPNLNVKDTAVFTY